MSSDLVCYFPNCKSADRIFSSKYALDKHKRSSHEKNDLLISGKRKRDSVVISSRSIEVENNNDPPSCPCGSVQRDKWNLNRHILSCPVVLPTNDKLLTINYKTLTIPSDKDLEKLRQTIEPLTSNIKVRICLYTGVCIPGVFPIIFNSNKGVLASHFNEFGLAGDLGLKTMWSVVEEESFIINEAFLIHLNDGRKVFLPPELLIPPETRSDLGCSFNSFHKNGFIHISRPVITDSNDMVDSTILEGTDGEDELPNVLRLRGGSNVNVNSSSSVPLGLISNCNRYLHPRLWTDSEIRTKIRITKEMFLEEFCPPLMCATQIERHEHEAKCFLFLIKMASNESFDSLASDFMISTKSARSWFLDISFAMFLTCPYIPSLFNDNQTSDAELDAFFASINNDQSPYIRHIVSAFCSADGRPVTLLNNDYTSLLMEGMSTEDFVKAQDMHSGLRGDKWAMYISCLVDGNGKVVAIPSGGGIGKSPRGGDCSANAEMITRELQQQEHRTFNKILQGTRNHAVLLNTDIGFVEKGTVNLGTRITTSQRCA